MLDIASAKIEICHSEDLLCALEVSANLYCNSRTSVLGRLRDYLRLLMGRTLTRMYIVQVRTDDVHEGRSREFKYLNSLGRR